jgi:peptidyl-tRNA hydrolase
LSGFVLSPFEKDERDAVRNMLERAADAVLAVAAQGIDRAMNVVNA